MVNVDHDCSMIACLEDIFFRFRRLQANDVSSWLQVFLGKVQEKAGHVFYDEDRDPGVLY